MTGNLACPVFAHPLGEVQLRVNQRAADLLCQALLRSHASYIMLAADRLDAESRELALEFVGLADDVTNGLVRLAQREREERRLELVGIHDDLLKRGYNVLSGRLAIAILHEPRDETGMVLRQWTERIEMTAAVITDVETSEAILLMPRGKVAPCDQGHIEPTRELTWSD